MSTLREPSSPSFCLELLSAVETAVAVGVLLDLARRVADEARDPVRLAVAVGVLDLLGGIGVRVVAHGQIDLAVEVPVLALLNDLAILRQVEPLVEVAVGVGVELLLELHALLQAHERVEATV
jgi:hypothetical protein